MASRGSGDGQPGVRISARSRAGRTRSRRRAVPPRRWLRHAPSESAGSARRSGSPESGRHNAGTGMRQRRPCDHRHDIRRASPGGSGAQTAGSRESNTSDRPKPHSTPFARTAGTGSTPSTPTCASRPRALAARARSDYAVLLDVGSRQRRRGPALQRCGSHSARARWPRWARASGHQGGGVLQSPQGSTMCSRPLLHERGHAGTGVYNGQHGSGLRGHPEPFRPGSLTGMRVLRHTTAKVPSHRANPITDRSGGLKQPGRIAARLIRSGL